MKDKSLEQEFFETTGGTTFLIRIYYRQNMSWQGVIQWLDGRKSMPFRSELEMIMLLQDALNEADTPETDNEFRKWDKKESF
ncbi:hypothetical protein SYNTR_1690 [Candidatus Syntrophocurvum alkaliphilum]|uniref:Uncharacterized protein n=1 Tax=Candidatus Syntrophocurvum alkaliphilum TaxID=2293317 RepID=A0A6I6DML8_9FIRM|nr:hypothetical protein [Candidatus Syntrophocurvum alkaliphilum]QGU00284.1 hypothetical protein SYNTR_1690 [Candidatus Syntrophocurvum alkaliphilum]